MFSIFRNRFGVPGVIAVIALVFAMIGGAYAATGDGGGKATASAKAKRGPRGPKGPKGPAGPQGPVGPVGPAGAPGLKGATGATGATGPTGPAGAKGQNGTAGATGPTGVTGPEGSPWTAGGTLPSGKTETGVFQTPPVTEPGLSVATISYPIPLAAAPSPANYVYLAPGEEKEECPGNIGEPKAKPGFVCLYSGGPVKATKGGTFSFTSGALLLYTISEAGGLDRGTFAVTAP